MEDDDCRALPDFTDVQLGASDGNAAFTRRRAPLASSEDDEHSGIDAAYAQARTTKTSVAFMGLKLHQPVTLHNPVPTSSTHSDPSPSGWSA